MGTTIRLDESRVVNGWIKTVDGDYIREDDICYIVVDRNPVEGEIYIRACLRGITTLNDDGLMSTVIGTYIPSIERYMTTFDGMVVKDVGGEALSNPEFCIELDSLEAQARGDLDAFVATHGRLL